MFPYSVWLPRNHRPRHTGNMDQHGINGQLWVLVEAVSTSLVSPAPPCTGLRFSAVISTLHCNFCRIAHVFFLSILPYVVLDQKLLLAPVFLHILLSIASTPVLRVAWTPDFYL